MIREADANTEDQIRNLGRLNQQDQLRRKGVAACPACACCCFAQALFVLARTDVRFGPVVKSGLGRFFLADGQTGNPVVTSPSGPCALLFLPPPPLSMYFPDALHTRGLQGWLRWARSHGTR